MSELNSEMEVFFSFSMVKYKQTHYNQNGPTLERLYDQMPGTKYVSDVGCVLLVDSIIKKLLEMYYNPTKNGGVLLLVEQ